MMSFTEEWGRKLNIKITISRVRIDNVLSLPLAVSLGLNLP